MTQLTKLAVASHNTANAFAASQTEHDVNVAADATGFQALATLDRLGAAAAASLVDVHALALAANQFFVSVARSFAASLAIAAAVPVEAKGGATLCRERNIEL